MKKLYARFWLWKNGYCKHGVAYQLTPYANMLLSCSSCDTERLLRQVAEHKKREQKKQRMLDAL